MYSGGRVKKFSVFSKPPDSAEMFFYKLPENLLSKFCDVARTNLDINGEQIETLAFIVGVEENGDHHATHLIFPQQFGTGSNVDDKGKINFLDFFDRQNRFKLKLYKNFL